MKITDLLTKDTINLSITSKNKSGVIDELIETLNAAGKLSDKTAFREAIMAREEQSTTGVGDGIAIPHAKTSAVKAPAIAFGRTKTGANFDSLDGKPVHLIFMIAAPEGANNTHLEVLSRLSSILLNKEVSQKLMEAETKEEILEIINHFDKQKEEKQHLQKRRNLLSQ